MYVSVGQGGAVTVSYDGTTWFPRPSVTRNVLFAISYGNNSFVGVGAGGTVLQSVTVAADGDLNRDGEVTISDALLAMQMALGIVVPTPEDLAYGDVAPLVNDKPVPNGVIDLSDVVLILKKAIGEIAW
jgi:hypothetical protein